MPSDEPVDEPSDEPSDEPRQDLTEAQARDLLARAGATIDVEVSPPMTLAGLPEPRSRRWPVLVAAAAAVVALVGGGLLVTEQLGDDPAGPAPDRSAGADAAADRAPVEQEHTWADDRLPGLIGHTRAEARELLAERGVEARVVPSYSCDQPPGYVVGTDPGPGSPLDAGTMVRLEVTAGPDPAVRCARPTDNRQPVWDLIRFARGLGPWPADLGVWVAAGGGEYVELSADEAADPAAWVQCADGECHSALAALRDLLTRSLGPGTGSAGTSVVMTEQLPEPELERCVTPDPLSRVVLRYHPSTYLFLDVPTMDRPCPVTPVLQIDWTEDHRISAVRLRLGLPTTSSSSS